MNAGWMLSVALSCCGADYAEPYAVAQAQFGQVVNQPVARITAAQPVSQFGAPQTPAYTASSTAQYQSAANTAPTLPPSTNSSFGQAPAVQTYQPAAQPQTVAQVPRGSVFSAQPTTNSSSQGWTGATDPRYTASVANDPRYAAAPQLSAPENAAAQQYANQLSTAATQFNNTLRDGQQQAQQVGQQYGQQVQTWQQQAQQYGQQAQQLGQQAQQYAQPVQQLGQQAQQYAQQAQQYGQQAQQQAQQLGQQAQQWGQQAQPYLSSLTNNPYAYVPSQPQPDPAANQYLASNTPPADNQFGRSVLVNSQNTGSSFGQQPANQYAANPQPQNNVPSNWNQQYQPQQQPSTQFVNVPAPPTNQFGSNQQPVNNTVPHGSTPSAFTSSAGQNQATQPAQDPRFAAQDPRYPTDNRTATQDPRTLTLDPPLTTTLPNSANNQNATGNNDMRSPYENLQMPRADGQNNGSNAFGSSFGTPRVNGTTNFTSGTKTEAPPSIADILPTIGQRTNQPFSNNGMTAGQGVQNPLEPDKAHLWNVLIGCLVFAFASVGANFYFGWNFTEYYFRYRRLLVEGEDDDRSRTRDEDRRR